MRRTWPARCAAKASPAAVGMERRLRSRDMTLRVATKNGKLRLAYASTLGLLRETIRRHRLATHTHGHRPFLELLGTHLSFTNLLAVLQEGEERVSSRFTADEATIVTEALALGECRCYVRGENNDSAQWPPFSLKVERALYGRRAPFTSMTAARLDLIFPVEEVGELSDADAMSWLRIGLGNMPREKLLEYFRHNISLHGYNFFRQSEGSTSTLWCRAHLDAPSIQQALASCVETATTHAADSSFVEAETKLEAALERAGLSYGLLLQPMVSGGAVERDVQRLQQAVFGASIATPEVFCELNHRAVEKGLACQDSLALFSGDHEGAYAVATAARQYTQDPDLAAPTIETLRRKLGINDFRVPLDPAAVVRNGVDYFCRCSKENFLRSVMTLPREELQRLVHETSFRCTFCAKEHSLQPEDWQRALQGRVE
ncbi:putative heat shock protein 33 [Trypanosoma conorhini]|uniref:Putative heat shock protein 33 n=1 Tax=Trypanosoma conorhini TaxID=83891 RepID=A0A422PIA2_9TRYP|nr:putative heat shock protein 33 [Trypanosoma conorhini]RNF17426.1 putative heat shock protein 33 [Trypanosoma conorhini]